MPFARAPAALRYRIECDRQEGRWHRWQIECVDDLATAERLREEYRPAWDTVTITPIWVTRTTLMAARRCIAVGGRHEGCRKPQ
jgi:hypothetical protein